MTKFDLIIVGAGPGGYETAALAARNGLRTVIIEAAKAGGTCLNEGCIPTKCFCRNAEVIRELKSAGEFGINTASFNFSLSEAVRRKDEVIENLRQGILSLMKHPNITFISGKARFIGRNSVAVESAEQLEETEFEAPNIIIATGSVTNFLPIPGARSKNVLTSTELLNLQTVPAKLCIIGGGVIGMEFASIFNEFGSKVTVLEYCKEILPNLDSDTAKRLRLSLKGQGISILTSAQVTKIEETASGCVTTYLSKDLEQQEESDIVLMAVGRRANLDSLNLADVGIETDRRGILTDSDFRTNIPNIFAVGDVNGKCQLAHAASFQGKHVLNLILGRQDNIRFDIIPSAVFTYPEMASVGLDSDQCKQQGIAVQTHKAFYRANGKALALKETEGLAKILSDENGKIVGCQILGAHASDLIHEISVLMNCGATLENLKESIHAHPTLSEIIMNAAEN